MTTVPAAYWTPRKRRLLFIVVALALIGVALALVLRAFNSNIVFYLTPTQVAEGQAQGKDNVRIGGLVEKGSIRRCSANAMEVRFVLTDMTQTHSVPVVFRKCALPDLFAEGKGAIADGKLDAQGQLIATEVLAKHDENYVAPGMEAKTGPAKR